ncbi:sulfite exporter TauE/SafE family protein [Steroidobacter sp.]|uniref:sulfite exporter TauE/SafE family protein n=1 Tax=Steroidobacter sp. TaxID=1978227 RepID=UPI001A436D43|nr:sulfite exporter TauE/SafE family protein [Steroidobacter sp.]MBL8268879.1 sulfite exporter TauE/SafE family protein [Steroidobacter sp.]
MLTLASYLLISALVVTTIWFVWQWWRIERARREGTARVPRPADGAIGFVTNFFDTLGIGSFAPTTAIFKIFGRMPDEKIPGTLNVGHALPTLLMAVIFIGLVQVEPVTLVGMIVAAVAGAWMGAGVIARLPRRAIQIGMGIALLIASLLFVANNLQWLPGGGDALGLSGIPLVGAIAINFVLGALMTLGVGLYAPCLMLVSLLGMNPLAAFPIMMGSCAFLMPIGGIRFVRTERYDLRASLGLAIGGIPGVLIAAFIVKSLPIDWLRWLVAVVVAYTALLMLWSVRPRVVVAQGNA